MLYICVIFIKKKSSEVKFSENLCVLSEYNLQNPLTCKSKAYSLLMMPSTRGDETSGINFTQQRPNSPKLQTNVIFILNFFMTLI